MNNDNIPMIPRRSRPFDSMIETTENHICDYSWLLNLATCGVSICTMLLVIIFFIWAATRGEV